MQNKHKSKLTFAVQCGLTAFALMQFACAEDKPKAKGGTGGSSGTGGSPGTGGKASGGSTAAGGNKAGGATVNGGSTSTGGTTAKTGGSTSGGATSSGGNTQVTGGTQAGGTTTNGGAPAAGGNTGGVATQGGSPATGGNTGSGERPPGYFQTKDWGVTSVDWHGCVWTGKDSDVPGSATSITPQDFMAGKDGGPYQVSGSVFNSYEAVALVGFNIGEAVSGKSDQCIFDPDSGTKDRPPEATMPSGATGIAVNWTATKLPLTFRIQIQGSKSKCPGLNCWCATIKDPNGPSFVPFSEFNSTCWDNKGTAYKNEPISAVSFLVPGTTSSASPFDITVTGFAPGTSKADAPGKAAACGSKTGTIGTSSVLPDTLKASEASMQRTAVQGKDCKTYVVNNNNWGQKASTYQQISYAGNSLKVDAANGSVSGQGVPASFPSIQIGANGDLAGGAFNTWADSGLPKSIGEMKSAQSTFKWGGKSSGDFNVTYDIWFAKETPTPGYDDGISGLLMVWLYKPGSRSPIGSVKRQATIGGNTYDVWIGPRGTTSKGTNDSGRPVISYVAKSTITNFSGDLKAFFDDAVKNGDADKSAGGTSQAFANGWLLTDVFGGFELWSGGDGVGLTIDEFTAKIQ